MQTDRDRAHRAAMAACALASVFGAGTPALAKDNPGEQGNAYGHADAGANDRTGTCHHTTTTTTTSQSSGSSGGSAEVETHAKGGAQTHAKAKAFGRVKAHGQARAGGRVRVSGKVDVNSRRHGAVRLQAKHERGRRGQAAAAVRARAHARKITANVTVSASAHAPAWLSAGARVSPASYQAWLAERAHAQGNGWAFGHFRQLVEAQLGTTVVAAKGNGNGNEHGKGAAAGTLTGTTGVIGATGTSGTAGTTGESADSGAVLGTSTSGGSGSGSGSVAGATASNAPVTATRTASASRLPFTGSDDWIVAAAGALMLLGGLALRRRLAGQEG